MLRDQHTATNGERTSVKEIKDPCKTFLQRVRRRTVLSLKIFVIVTNLVVFFACADKSFLEIKSVAFPVNLGFPKNVWRHSLHGRAKFRDNIFGTNCHNHFKQKTQTVVKIQMGFCKFGLFGEIYSEMKQKSLQAKSVGMDLQKWTKSICLFEELSLGPLGLKPGCRTAVGYQVALRLAKRGEPCDQVLLERTRDLFRGSSLSVPV